MSCRSAIRLGPPALIALAALLLLTLASVATATTGPVTAGGEHGIALKDDGTLWGWGAGYGLPTMIGSEVDWMSVDANGRASYAVKTDGSLWCLNSGIPPTRIGTDSDWAAVSSGWTSAFGIKRDGTLWAWGSNTPYGQLGTGGGPVETAPVRVGGDNDWATVDAGESHALAIKRDGSLWAWGQGGLLGDGTWVNGAVPVRVGAESDWVTVATGGGHCLGIRADGSLWSWGSAYYGQLGDGRSGAMKWSLVPTRVGTETGWVSVAAGNAHSLALKADGTVWGWGWNEYGQTGDGSVVSIHTGDPFEIRTVPVQVGTGTDWAGISAGWDWSAAWKADGSVWAWGQNWYGQLGDLGGIRYGRSNPCPVLSLGPDNLAPVAEAGPDQAVLFTGTIVALDGSGSSDEDGDPLTYAWRLVLFPAGSAAALSDPSAASPTFVADRYGDYVAELVVSDGIAESAPDRVTVSFANLPPVADAGGNRAAVKGDTLLLDGSASSDPNHDVVTFQWTFLALPEGSAAAFDDPSSPAPSFTADLSGEYIAALVVNDGSADSPPALATIQVVDLGTGVTDVLTELINAINLDLGDSFRSPEKADAMTGILAVIIGKVENGNFMGASQQLANSVLAKTDGCALENAPDNNDWITDCDAQAVAYPLVMRALELLAREL
jgi:alpha-tubulin suppressor-like RCC1 family protein